MSFFKPLYLIAAISATLGCNSKPQPPAAPAPSTQPAVAYFHPDPATSATLTGTIHFFGKRPVSKTIDMSEDPACVEAHQGKAHDESLVLGPKDALANTFIYIRSGLEGKTFEVPATPVTITQKGCWFGPRVQGIQVNQILDVVNSDPVTHNIHPMAVTNREWNHSQGPGDAPIHRHFLKPEVMIPIKCNIHSWMHAYLGVLDHPYFAVSKPDGTFTIPNLPPGTYTLSAWHENMATENRQITIAPHTDATADFTFKTK